MHGLHVIMVFITLNRCRSLEFANIDVCSQRASIRPQQRIKLLDYAYLHATLNLTLITEVHADIVESYLLAKKELAETLSDSNANIATPDYAGFDTNYYVLQNKHHLNDADALCIAQGYRPLSLTRSEEFLALLKYLKARNIKITSAHKSEFLTSVQQNVGKDRMVFFGGFVTLPTYF